MNEKELYQQKMQAQLDEWKAEVDKLKAEASGASADTQLEINEAIKALEAKIEEGESKLAELAEANEEAWGALKEGMESAWDSITAAFSEAAERFKRGKAMISAGEHQGKLLISITNGEKLGEVKDMYFDSELTKVTAVLAGSEGGIFSRKDLAITRPDIQVYGVDAWLIAGADTVVRPENITDADIFVTLSDLHGHEIQTEGGTKIGTVGDVLLDTEARVLGFTLQTVHVQGPLAERKTIARSAIVDVGSKDTPMLTVLADAETALVEEN